MASGFRGLTLEQSDPGGGSMHLCRLHMLPSPEKLPAAMRGIYRREVWGGFPVSDRHLERAREFHEEMKNPVTIDPERMSYIAGCNRRTLSGLEVGAGGVSLP